jgi:DNA processing protein
MSAAERPPEAGPGWGACGSCLRRSWLLGRLSAHLDRTGARALELLALDEQALLAAIGGGHAGTIARELDELDPVRLAEHAAAAGVRTLCGCRPEYPARLQDLDAPPALLYLAGEPERAHALLTAQTVAIVGTRRPSAYGLELARSLSRGLAAAGVPVISGMALGIDSAAHVGALELDGPTLAVLPAAPERPHPASRRALHRRILACGAALAELGPATPVRRWMFPARNRLIAALAALTVVVEAGTGSGALVSAAIAARCGRAVGAVPGRVGTMQAEGTNALLAGGASVVRGTQDVLDLLFGAGIRQAPPSCRPALPAELERLLAAVAEGHDTAGALSRAGIAPDQGLAALARLELEGYVRRGAGGRFTVIS